MPRVLDTDPTFTADLPRWSFQTGEGLDSQGLTQFEMVKAAMTLVTVLVGIETFAAGFEDAVARTRAGEDPTTCSVAYIPRNAEAASRGVVANMIAIAATASDPSEGRDRLFSACSAPLTIRSIDGDDWDGPSIPEDGDRRKALRAQRQALFERGAVALGRRGSYLCMACESTIPIGERFVEPLAETERRVRRDYCANCAAGDFFLDGHRRDRHAITSVLAAARPLLTPSRPWDVRTRGASLIFRS